MESYGIKIIRTGVNHPQTNGKLEKLNDTCGERNDFESFETPEEAFWRKSAVELVGNSVGLHTVTNSVSR